MLQQTQVSRVVPYYRRFIGRFPTVKSLARAEVDDVLAHWAGLGYYRRARHLHAAARTIVSEYDGRVPSDLPSLLVLPGIGRYTAGAIRSIAYNLPAPIVDGNVTRVLLRLRGKVLKQAEKSWVWDQAESLVGAACSPAGFNEGLMELGATICMPSPQVPRCEECPWRQACAAHRDQTTDVIPPPKSAPKTATLHCATIIITDKRGRLKLEQRPPTGLWAGLWQCPTLESKGRLSAQAVLDFARLKGAIGTPRKIGVFTHTLSHRTVKFTAYAAPAVECVTKRKLRTGAVWCVPSEMEGYAISNAQKKAIALADIAERAD